MLFLCEFNAELGINIVLLRGAENFIWNLRFNSVRSRRSDEDVSMTHKFFVSTLIRFQLPQKLICDDDN